MATNYTSNYGLCQWVAADKVLRTEFNEDNAKIDAAIAAVNSQVSGLSASSVSQSELNSLKSTVSSLQTTVSGKADKSALDSLKTTVNGKADKTALSTLSATVSQLGSTLNGKGNCSLFIASYTGKGTYGADNLNSLIFLTKPEIIFITSPEGMLTVLIQGQELSYSSNGGSGSPLKLTWTGNTVKWYNHMSAAAQLNLSGKTYTAVALARAG